MVNNDPLGLTPQQRAASDANAWIEKIVIPRWAYDMTAPEYTGYDLEGEIIGDVTDEPLHQEPTL